MAAAASSAASFEKFSDDKAASFWEKKFGSKKKVSNKDFAAALADQFDLDADVATTLAAHVIDTHDGDGLVTRWELEAFCRRFGSFDKACAVAQMSLFEGGVVVPWFHGPATREDAEKKLRKEGEFLVRFSSARPSKLILMVCKRKNGKLCTKNLLIHLTALGFSLTSKPSKDQAFSDVRKLLLANSNECVLPVVSELHKLAKAAKKTEGKKDGGAGDAYASFEAGGSGGGAYSGFADDGADEDPYADSLGGGAGGAAAGGNYAAFDDGAGGDSGEAGYAAFAE